MRKLTHKMKHIHKFSVDSCPFVLDVYHFDSIDYAHGDVIRHHYQVEFADAQPRLLWPGKVLHENEIDGIAKMFTAANALIQCLKAAGAPKKGYLKYCKAFGITPQD
jgi:hypothetical protein